MKTLRQRIEEMALEIYPVYILSNPKYDFNKEKRDIFIQGAIFGVTETTLDQLPIIT